ncbi:MAG TPA: hypothetical protein VK945_01535 [Planococcus sp. (in: firmicutes)]|nr:hypothetical protein [Planococcus sp. (in: firmicutes)]
MSEMLNDLTTAITNKTKCLASSTVIMLKYMAMILVPLYILYLILN